jgi:hypothetical protein
MTWTVVAAQDESVWTEEYLDKVLSSHARKPLPPHHQKIGATEVFWNEVFPGEFVVHAQGGSVDDRLFVRYIVSSQLAAYGMRPAMFTLGGPSLSKTASWADVMAKAQRLRQEGRVQVLRNGANVIVGHVQGDNGDYQTEISRDDPNSDVITTWQCECPWDQFAWQRTRKWKPLEGRVCSHVLATYWAARTMPLDEEYDPQAGATIGPGGQLGFGAPGMQPTVTPAGPGGRFAPAPGEAPQQLSIPGIAPGTAEATPPVPGTGVLPPYPGPPMPVPTSVPGGKVPTPDNPMQYPGGTFSSVRYPIDLDEWVKTAGKGDTFINSDMVRLENEEYGIAEGKSVEHGAGQYRIIPANSIGEVLGQDTTTGWVDVIFPLHDTGPMEPYHVRAWVDPANLTPMPNVKKPGPFIRRR